MTRIERAFAAARAAGRPAVVAYVMAGEPDRARSLDHAAAVLDAADALEIGVPFSDPVADGPVIERAHTRALDRGIRMGDALDLARALRGRSEKPVLLMTYYNPILQRGLARFARECRDAGVDGVISPDLPLEESGPLDAALAKEGVALVQLASPATPPDRMARLAKATRGFLYVVSSFGVTGARDAMPAETAEVVSRAKAACGDGVPFAVGFGVSSAEHVRRIGALGAPGVVVGSAIVKRVEDGASPADVGAFVRSLAAR